MQRITTVFSFVLLSLLANPGLADDLASDPKYNWPQWRGPLATGAAPHANPPTTWSETNGIKWKVAIPGTGSSTPAIWRDKIFLTAAVPTGKKAEEGSVGAGRDILDFLVLCLDRETGKELWRKTATQTAPHEGHHPDHGYASGSPVTDGDVVIAYFGSRGLHCYDLEGNLKWSKQFGSMKTRNSFGEGASPALHGDTVVLYWDDEKEEDFIVALDRKTGKELWKNPRNENTGWSTPLIVEHAGKAQVVVNAEKRVRSYELATGKQIWECGGQTANAIPTPVASQDTVFAASGFRGSALLAIALGREGDLTGTDAIRWNRNRNTPYVPSPLLAGGMLYLVTENRNVITCLEARTGNPNYEAEKLEGINSIYASPVSAAGKVYVLGRNGHCYVLALDKEFKVLARNTLDEKTDATPALVGKEIFIRGRQSLYCIGQ